MFTEFRPSSSGFLPSLPQDKNSIIIFQDRVQGLLLFKSKLQALNIISKTFQDGQLDSRDSEHAPVVRNVKPQATYRQIQSDGRVLRTCAPWSCRLGFDSKSGKTKDFKIGIHSFLA